MKNNIVAEYEKAKQAIYDHVGIEEDWVVYPIIFTVKELWQIDQDNEQVKFADNEEKFNSDGDYCIEEIYKQRFYKKHVYRGEEYTLIFCDSCVDGMKWWRIFKNEHEVNNEE